MRKLIIGTQTKLVSESTMYIEFKSENRLAVAGLEKKNSEVFWLIVAIKRSIFFKYS